MSAKIFVCTYNEKPVIHNDLYIPIQVGAANNSYDICYLKDNMGDDNISEKNAHYSEQSAVYWVWKHIKNLDYVGFCHYRKMLCLTDTHNFKKCDITMPSEEWIAQGNLDVNIDYMMKDCDIIMTNQMNLSVHRINIFEHYCRCHVKEDILLVERILKTEYPSYMNAWNSVMYSADGKFHPYNTYIMRWEWFEKWCTFIFDIFGKMEKIMGLEYHIGYQTRVFGYLAERILDVFVKRHKLRVKTRPIALFSDFFSEEKTHNMKEEIALGKTGIREIRLAYRRAKYAETNNKMVNNKYIATNGSWKMETAHSHTKKTNDMMPTSDTFVATPNKSKYKESTQVESDTVKRTIEPNKTKYINFEDSGKEYITATPCTNFINIRAKEKDCEPPKIKFVQDVH